MDHPWRGHSNPSTVAQEAKCAPAGRLVAGLGLTADGELSEDICQYWRGKARQIFDIGPNADFPAKHRGNTMRFRIQRPDGTQSRWRWRLTDDGLHMSYRARNSQPANFVLTRYRSRCLDRWRPAHPAYRYSLAARRTDRHLPLLRVPQPHRASLRGSRQGSLALQRGEQVPRLRPT